VFEYLTEERNIPPEHIVLYGRSLGSGPSCYLAARSASNGRFVAGLILHAPFTSVYRVALPDFFGCTVGGDMFPNIDRMEDVECPVFIAHKHGRALLEAAPRRDRAEFFSQRGMHHNWFESVHVEQELMEALNRYLDYHVLARRLWMVR